MSFTNLGLSDQLIQGIIAAGYSSPTPIQTKAIPPAIAGKDIIGCAQTGTGKTAAFLLPILQHLSANTGPRDKRHIRALVLTPTRELAQQVEEFVTGYSRFTMVKSLSIYGGVSMDKQLKSLRRGVDIVIATPGRLIDHIHRKTINLSQVTHLVLDEADRMLDMGFIDDVREIVYRLPEERQTFLFSATISEEITDLIDSFQKNPEYIEVGEQRRPVETVRQHFYSVAQDTKLDLLFHLLQTQPMESVIVFTRTKHGADKVSRRLEKRGLKSMSIHSDRTQAQRQRALAGFKEGRFSILVATDIAARGIDVDGISHVVNYDTPQMAEAYIHRIGRTGRASATGDAITFVSNEERKYWKSIENFIGKKHELKKIPFIKVRENTETQSQNNITEVNKNNHSNRRKKKLSHKNGNNQNQQRNLVHTKEKNNEKSLPTVDKQHHKSAQKNRSKDFIGMTQDHKGNNNRKKKKQPDNFFTKFKPTSDWSSVIRSIEQELKALGKK